METRQKIPVPRHSFLWSLNETSGEILTHLGPTEFTPSANDRIVRANIRGGFEQAPMEARAFILARDGEYVLITNPVVDVPDAHHPNGGFVPGGNKEKELRMGTTRIIPGPCAFPLWPGQSAEVRPAHKLSANHYLIVEVVGDVDESAPYYDLVKSSAELSSVVIDITEGEGAAEGPSDPDAPSSSLKLRTGQRIVIQGRHTEFFIPPSGIEVVPNVEEGDSRSSNDDDDGIESLPAAATEELAKLLNQVSDGLTTRQFSVLKNELRHRQDFSTGERAVMLTALDDAWSQRSSDRRRKSSSHRSREAIDPYARKAVVLGPKNFCILFDADGNPRIVKGPARVFPGPADTFMYRGSRRRVYDAYELGEHQALWVRIITSIGRTELAQRLPPGTELKREHYEAGAELLVRGLPSVFFPFIEGEILNPESREPHVGNDHENVIINAVGIDQKSGIYVRDLGTGMVKMIRGETSYLVDPRAEEHVHRRVVSEQWNLWIAHAEPHKQATSAVVTPWAISVTIPNNEAILITSRHGRRVAVGPRTELLEYEEQLTPLRFSKGPIKDGSKTVTTCFLRITGCRFCDTLELESADFVKFKVRLGVSGHFAGDPERWFNVEDPVKLLADSVRARLREAARGQRALQIMGELPALVRATLFGESEAWAFSENGMVVERVDVLQVNISDNSLAETFASVQREAVSLQLKDRQLQRRLDSTRLRDAIDSEEHAIQRDAQKRMAETSIHEAKENHAVELVKANQSADLEDHKSDRKQQRTEKETAFHLRQQAAGVDARVVSKLKEAEADSKAAQLQNAVSEAHDRAVAEIEHRTAEVYAEADAKRLKAIEAELVGALHAAADSEVMKAAAENMNLVALLGGKTPGELFAQVLKGTPLERTSRSMSDRSGGKGSKDE
ncbi:MAG: hypothetical protein R3A51_10750 [Nannocystaceae bacterium]|nr:hypothetical protein [Myxococcales bacterium]